MPQAIIEFVAIVWLYMSVCFAMAVAKKDNGLADVAWGLGFVLLAVYSYFKYGQFQLRQSLVTAMVVLWGLRLSGHIFVRGLGKGEDFRYKKWRDDWGKNWVWRSYLQVFMLQGFFMLAIALPLLVVNVFPGSASIGGLDCLGVLLFAFGFCFEAVADFQLLRFKSKPANKGKIMQSGLWRYSRHPNYFGEALVWWAFFLIALAAAPNPLGLVSIVSPILVTWLLTSVSGVPLLESKYKSNPEYARYVESTSAFIPQPPKK